jgi:3-phenylpropionate/trans-cinnamate dioxygenase ferredoxin reductase component
MPYERPHLSKRYLLGTVSRAELALRPAQQYRNIVLRRGERIVRLDLRRRELRFESDEVLRWDLLCITVGSDARRLTGYERAMYLRELDQATVLKTHLESHPSLSIVGAGFIGCEVAAVAASLGRAVHTYEAMEQPLQRVLGPELGAYLAGVHRAHGVDLMLRATSLPPDGAGVLVAVGSSPRTELAVLAGLAVDNGIVVDELGHTSEPGVFAAGDVTRFFHPLFETRIRVEHFQTAQRQGFAVGRTMGGIDTPFLEVPWFWSDQYDLNLQYVGAGLPWDETVTRGEMGRPPFTVFYLSGGRLLGAAGVNDHHTVARARRLMEARREVSREKLADPSFDLRRALV